MPGGDCTGGWQGLRSMTDTVGSGSRLPLRRGRRLLLAAGAATALSAMLGRAGQAAPASGDCGAPPAEPAPFATPDPGAHWTAAAGPTAVQIVRRDEGYSYLV